MFLKTLKPPNIPSKNLKQLRKLLICEVNLGRENYQWVSPLEAQCVTACPTPFFKCQASEKKAQGTIFKFFKPGRGSTEMPTVPFLEYFVLFFAKNTPSFMENTLFSQIFLLHISMAGKVKYSFSTKNTLF